MTGGVTPAVFVWFRCVWSPPWQQQQQHSSTAAAAGRAYLPCAADAKIGKRPAHGLGRCSAHRCQCSNVRRLQALPNHGPRAPHSLRSVKAFRDGCRASLLGLINLACRDAGRRLGDVLLCAILAACSRYHPSCTPSDGL